MNMQKRLECKVSGRVQMVMFRDFVKRTARKMGVVGTVCNSIDGSVFVRAEGEEEKLKDFLTLVKKGPMFARVDNVAEQWLDPLGGFKSFDILY